VLHVRIASPPGLTEPESARPAVRRDARLILVGAAVPAPSG